MLYANGYLLYDWYRIKNSSKLTKLTSRAKTLFIELKEKIQFVISLMNLFQVNGDPLQMAKEYDIPFAI